MQDYYYLIVLIFSLSSLGFIDFRHRLAFFRNFKDSFVITGLCLMFFVAWDVVGINLGVFHTNQSWVSGPHVISADLPVEEFLFLTFLGYLTLLGWKKLP